MTDIADRLEELREAGLYRRLRLVSGPQGPRVLLDGREVLLLCSNNYLGLADHPSVRRAAAEAAMRWGTGAGASRLISGNMTLHRRLEERLADFHRTEAALLFGSGYLANAGTIAALTRPGEVVFSDELNHASIVDGCRLSRAETFVYRHADPEHLAWGLARAEGRGSLIVTDGVFSMDGDVAPIPALVELARRHDCRLMVDEAHATGAIGPDGEGAVAESGLGDEVDLIVGTLGKALGSYGAYVCASREITELLVNAARPFIFSTALPPPSVAAAIASLKLIGARPERVDRLRRNGDMMRRELAAYGLDPGESRTQIIPLIVGDAEAAVELCERALERGVFAQAIRPPTVPEGTSRLRITVMASHRASELRHAAKIVGTAARDLGLSREADEWHWEEPVPADPREADPIPSKAPPRPPAVGAPSLASQMPPGPLSIDLDEAA
jgi:8-amino-7-oxononanoate synthase